MRKFALALAALAFVPLNVHAETAVKIAPPATQATATGETETAVIAGGCFWGIQAVYQHMKGVKNAVSGYAGGDAKTAKYQQVGMGTTGHAEAVKVTFDPKVVSYGQILQVFFSVAHDPTQLNRQGPDTGPSYRSAIFPQNADQRRVAAAYIAQLGRAHAYAKPIVTKLETGGFYPAEAYHQDFFSRNPTHPYIVRWDKPKVTAFRNAFPQLAN